MLRGRSSSKLTTRLDSEGNLVEVESREDEEQNIKLQETVDLLLAAGYFRARIKGLSPFDKVVGGMTWCIEVCNFDIDVDLLFQENLTIGQKIALTEKIVSVLPKMKCPHRLEPHQIQGLDFIHIFPVVQWLVKRAIETREEMGDYIRSYSLSQFHKEHRTPEDEAFLETKENHRESMLYLQEIYKQQRQFKRHDSHILKDEETRVQSTLLEYGRHLSLRFSAKSQDSKKDVKNSQLLERQDSAEDSRLAAEHIKTLMSGMSATDDHEHKLTATAVGSIVGLQSAEIQQIASEYKDKQAEISSGDAGEKIGSIQQHKRIIASLTKQTEQQKAKQGEIEEKHSDVKKTYLDVQEKLQETKDYKNKIAEDMKIYDEMENNENKSVFNKLRTLVALNENLKNQELEFKTHCKEEMARLKSSIEELHSECAEDDSEDHERTQLIETQLHHDKEKLHKIRLLLARKNREIASLQRKIDEVPTRAELSQYQRRFVELYNQVAATHKETKQFYTLYNILDDTKMYLSKEVNLLNSILDNFTEAMSSVSTKEQFLKQFEQIVEGIKQNKIKLERKKQEEKMRRDRLNDTYLDLIEKQRLYFKTVKDFKEECRKNELLLAKLKGLGQ